jgi:hypothetical protein
MPYIKTEIREKLDPHISALALLIAKEAGEEKDELAIAGMLNYACTCLALRTFYKVFGKFRYKFIALFTGIFENIKQEFYTRIATPYEKEACWEHKDLPEFVQAEKLLAAERAFKKQKKQTGDSPKQNKPRPPIGPSK